VTRNVWKKKPKCSKLIIHSYLEFFACANQNIYFKKIKDLLKVSKFGNYENKIWNYFSPNGNASPYLVTL
jgi:hypothetical protein